MAQFTLNWVIFLLLIFTRRISSLALALPTNDLERPKEEREDIASLPARTLPKKVLPLPSDPIPDEYLPEDEDEDDSDSPSILIHVVKNKDLKSWLESQGPDAYLIRSSSVLYLHHRVPRQAPGPPQPPGTPTINDDDDKPKVGKVVTPAYPINGVKKYNATDCMPWPEMAAIIRSNMLPKYKSFYIDPKSCDINQGLECLPFEERGAVVYRCECQLIYGAKAVYTNWTDITGRIKKGCFIPAGLGWESECYAKHYNNYGYPLPFGDPAGTNAEAAVQQDAYNKPDGEQIIVDYIRWNSIKPLCVPFSECRERGTYPGQRCQCLKDHKLMKPEGKCSGAENIRHVISAVALVLMQGLL